MFNFKSKEKPLPSAVLTVNHSGSTVYTMLNYQLDAKIIKLYF